MKRRTVILSLFCLSIVSGFSQDTIRIYMDNNFKVVEKDSCTILRKAVIDDEKIYHIWDSYIDGRKIVSGEFSSIHPWVEEGYFRYYDESGYLYSEGNFDDAFMTGQWIYYDNGKPDTVDYTPSLKLLGKLYVLDQVPVPGQKDLSPSQKAYIYSHIHFPYRARDLFSHSKATVRLTVKKNGKRTPEILQGYHKDFIYEACRLLLEAPDSVLFEKSEKPIGGSYIFEIGFNKDKSSAIVEEDSIVPKYDTSLAYVFVDEQAEFHGGDINEFRDWVQKNLVYPPDAVKKMQQGRVTIQFTVGLNGHVEQVKMLRTCGNKSIDEEAVRIVQQSPVWVPARQGDQSVKQIFVIPVIFMLR